MVLLYSPDARENPSRFFFGKIWKAAGIAILKQTNACAPDYTIACLKVQRLPWQNRWK